MHPLDNPAWHALTGPHHTVAEQRGRAARYHADVTPFAALDDSAGTAAWNDLRELVGPGGAAVLFRGETPTEPGWQRLAEWPAVQMLAPRGKTYLPGTPPSDPVTDLGPDDVDDMVDLVARTEPGPFAKRTIDLGPYIGVRHHGRLVAMAGVRMRPPDYAEISAVCTDPSHRGRGLGALLVRRLTQRVESWGETAFLHATQDNVNAIRLYEAMGFTVRGTMDVALLRAPA